MNLPRIDWKLIVAIVMALATGVNSVMRFEDGQNNRIAENTASINGIKQMLIDRETIARDYRSGLDRRFDKIDGKLDRLVERK